MNRGNIETREEYVKRTVEDWVLKGKDEFHPFYFQNFCDRWRIFGSISDKSIVAEVGPGAYGGILEVLQVKCAKKIFIDYVMDELKGLSFIRWPEDAVYLNCPAEHIELEDNEVDVLVSYNCLDHGWDIEHSIKECVRVAKLCFINFDCRGDDPLETTRHSPGFYKAHPKLLMSKDVVKFVKALKSNKAAVKIKCKPIVHSFSSVEFSVLKRV